VGQGSSFVWRRLHSLSGIFPIAAFLLEHFVSNAFATNGPSAYAEEVKFLTGIPLLVWVECLFIYLPILYHGLYGFYIWYRGQTNVSEYSFLGNWGYTIQRWTGAIAFFFMLWHTVTMRWMGVHLVGNAAASFGKVQLQLHHPWALALYIIGVLCASVHLSYGLWLFAAKWGVITGEKGRRRFAYACVGVCLMFLAIGYAALFSFGRWPQQPVSPAAGVAEQTLVNTR
jgi:succinate dehydrogenase / fumarate reductase cytochrome b subunit